MSDLINYKIKQHDEHRVPHAGSGCAGRFNKFAKQKHLPGQLNFNIFFLLLFIILSKISQLRKITNT